LLKPPTNFRASIVFMIIIYSLFFVCLCVSLSLAACSLKLEAYLFKKFLAALHIRSRQRALVLYEPSQ
jgi:hypothetical protein